MNTVIDQEEEEEELEIDLMWYKKAVGMIIF